MRITRQISPTLIDNCSLGFNSVWNNGLSSTFEVFSTASHCSETEGISEQDVFHQNTPNNQIGLEFRDPFGFDHDDDPYWCPIGVTCRWADFLLADYTEEDAVVGLIARTLWRGRSTGSTTIHSQDSVFYITSTNDWPIGGQLLNKVGHTTGWTYGWVTDTCKDYLDDGILYVCQYAVSGGAGPGDSGSPVFSWGGQHEVTLFGAVWAAIGSQKFVFSSLHKIKLHVYAQGGWFERLTYNGQLPGPPPLSVQIAGPSAVQPFEFCTWQALVSGGEQPYTYQWTGVLTGNSSAVSGVVSSGGWLNLAVTSDDGQQKNDAVYVAVSGGAPNCIE